MSQPNSLCAVLTSGLVKSSRHSPDELEAVRTLLLDAVAKAAGWRAGLEVGEAEFFHSDPGEALRVAVFRSQEEGMTLRLKLPTFDLNEVLADPDRPSGASVAAI